MSEALKEPAYRSLAELIGSPLRAEDGLIGQVVDFFFDDEQWSVRYLVANAGAWHAGRQVLVPVARVAQPSTGGGLTELPVRLTRQQIKDCPPPEEKQPISRQYEAALASYYQYDCYWEALSGIGGAKGTPAVPAPRLTLGELIDETARIEETHVRSFNEVCNYSLIGSDNRLGEVRDFIARLGDWNIRLLVVETNLWLPGGKVLLAPSWCSRIDWAEAKMYMEVDRATVNACPAWDPRAPINRDFEGRLYDFHGRAASW